MPGAVKRAKAYLWFYLVCEGLSYAAVVALTDGELKQKALISVIRVIVYFAVWYQYLNNSKRVRATYLIPTEAA